jgi:hypothetical protein
MVEIKIKYNGKEYSDISAAISDAIQNGLVEKMKEIANEKLSKFYTEIEKEGGKIILNVGDVLKNESSDISVSGVSDELLEKIQQDLSKK